jgi:hypothetical protein
MRAEKGRTAVKVDAGTYVGDWAQRIWTRLKGSIPEIEDANAVSALDETNRPVWTRTDTEVRTETALKRTPAASVNLGSVTDAKSREYARLLFDYNAFDDLFNVIVNRGRGRACELRPILAASSGLDRLGLRMLFTELPEGADVWRDLEQWIRSWPEKAFTPSQKVYALLPALQSAAETYARQRAAEARADRRNHDDGDDEGGQGGAPAAPPPQAGPHGRDKKDDDEPPEGPKGP